MSVDVADALRAGYERLGTPAGLQLVAVGFVVQLLGNVVSDSTIAQYPEAVPPGFPTEPGPLAIELPANVLGALGIVSLITSLLFTLVALRTFVADARLTVPPESYGENLLWPTLHLFVGGIVFGAAVGIGFVLLIVPGLFLLVSLLFFQVYVATEDEGFFEAMRDSWSLASGDRFGLVLLFVGTVIVGFLVAFAFAVVAVAVEGASPFVAGVVETVGSAVVLTYVLAVTVAAYNQLTGETPDEEDVIDTDWA